ncbi:MAG: pilin [Gammaproteobacteria bacterium]|nr:pilin [Gammaproteobacteria bacterium]NNJ72349.1 pilin [Enterobacterales bacterium]
MSSKLNGFTLIELMIVVAIMGIMVTLTLPSFQQYTVKTQLAEAITLTDDLKEDIAAYYKQYQKMPANNDAAGLPQANQLIGNYVSKVTVEDGAIHVQLGNKVNQNLLGKTITLQPFTVDGSPKSPISWGCGFAKVPEGMRRQGENNTDIDRYYLPVQCRI